MIIDCQLEDLVKERDTNLRLWLGKTECQTLIKVAEAQAKKFACAALIDATKATKDDHLLDGANANLRQAQQWTTFLDKLNSLIEQKTPFQTAKLS